jgi:hypothetical protein
VGQSGRGLGAEMGKSWLPDSDPGLLAWSLNFSTRISQNPQSVGLTPQLASAYAALHQAFATALEACDPAVRNEASVIAKNQARENLKADARLLNNLVQGTASVTDEQKRLLGLTIRARPSPVPPIAQGPTVLLEGMVGNTLRVRLQDATTTRRARPASAVGASVFWFVGPAPSEDPADWTFEANVSRTVFDIAFPESLTPGTTVWVTAFWFTARAQSSPAATPVSAVINYGSTPRFGETKLKAAA